MSFQQYNPLIINKHFPASVIIMLLFVKISHFNENGKSILLHTTGLLIIVFIKSDL